jgi:hypothetical protein
METLDDFFSEMKKENEISNNEENKRYDAFMKRKEEFKRNLNDILVAKIIASKENIKRNNYEFNFTGTPEIKSDLFYKIDIDIEHVIEEQHIKHYKLTITADFKKSEDKVLFLFENVDVSTSIDCELNFNDLSENNFESVLVILLRKFKKEYPDY